MRTETTSDPAADEITSWITTTYPDTIVGEAMNARFFSLDASQWPNFATIVTTDEHDMGTPSNLARDGVFRLNIGVGKATFERLIPADGEPDHAALDTILPHPVYAKQRWIAILNPSRQTFEAIVKPLLAEAHDRLAATTGGGPRQRDDRFSAGAVHPGRRRGHARWLG